MTKLDFGTEANADSAELAAFKKKVIAVAKKHSAEHHCGSVSAALRDLGIKETKPVSVRVATSHPFEFVVRVSPEEYGPLTEEQQREKISAQVNEMLATQSVSGLTITIPASSITSMEIVKAKGGTTFTDPIVAGSVTGTHIWLYTSDAGRVLHAYIHDRQRGSAAGHMALCGVDNYYTPVDHSSRNNTGVCQRCLARVGPIT